VTVFVDLFFFVIAKLNLTTLFLVMSVLWFANKHISRIPTESGKVLKKLVIFQPGKVWKKVFGLLEWKK